PAPPPLPYTTLFRSRGEGRDAGLLAAGLRRSHAIPRNSDDAILFAEQIKRFDRLFGQADDPFRRKHATNPSPSNSRVARPGCTRSEEHTSELQSPDQ